MPTPEIKAALGTLQDKVVAAQAPPPELPETRVLAPASKPEPVKGEAANPLAALGREKVAKDTVTPYMRGLEPWPDGPYQGQYRKVVQD